MAMHCPRCSTEYRDGFSECTDCHVPLAPGLPPAPSEEHDIDLVTVLESSDPFLTNLAKATLQDAGIRYVLLGDDADERSLTGMSPAGAHAAQFQVEASLAAPAREVLEPLLNPEPITETEGEEPA
jgi:hypothetical protein